MLPPRLTQEEDAEQRCEIRRQSPEDPRQRPDSPRKEEALLRLRFYIGPALPRSARGAAHVFHWRGGGRERGDRGGGGGGRIGGKLLEFARGESRRRWRAASFHWLGELPICVVILQEFLRGLTGSRAAAAAHSGRREGGRAGSAQPIARAPQRRAAPGPSGSGGAEREEERKERGGAEGARGPAPRPLGRCRPPVSPLCPALGGRRRLAGSAGIMRGVWLVLTVSFVACASGQPVSAGAGRGRGGGYGSPAERGGTGRGPPPRLRLPTAERAVPVLPRGIAARRCGELVCGSIS